MKKNIEIWSDYDRTGRWCLRMKKKRGRLTLDEIRDALRGYELDFYLIFVDAYHDEETQFDDDMRGDFITIYRTDLFND